MKSDKDKDPGDDYYRLDEVEKRLRAAKRIVNNKEFNNTVDYYLMAVTTANMDQGKRLYGQLCQLYTSLSLALEDAAFFAQRMIEIARQAKDSLDNPDASEP